MKGKKIIKSAKKSMKILKSGKIQVGDTKIDLEPLIAESSNSAIISRLDGIISNEDVILEDSTCFIDHVLQSQLKTSELSAVTKNYAENDTIVVLLPKKASLTIFDFLDCGIVGDLLRTSTLSISYKKVKKQWVELNKDDETEFTNVLYFPDILVFLNDEPGQIKSRPYKVNVLICAVPSHKQLAEAFLDKENPKELALMRLIGDALEAGIRIGLKNLIIDPFQVKALRKDRSLSAKLWNEAVSSQRIQENYNGIKFSFTSEGEFIVFAGNK